jgi:hypothetical protein
MQSPQQNPEQAKLFDRLRNKPFWFGILKNIRKKISKQKEIAA